MRHTIPFAVVALFAIATTSCDESLSKLAGPTPSLEPTFTSVQQNIFELTDSAGRNACVSCHTTVGRTPPQGMSLEHSLAYDQTVNVPSRERPNLLRIAPGNPDASYLVMKIEERAGITGRRMPFNGPPFMTDGQILILRRWIEIGAPRN